MSSQGNFRLNLHSCSISGAHKYWNFVEHPVDCCLSFKIFIFFCNNIYWLLYPNYADLNANMMCIIWIYTQDHCSPIYKYCLDASPLEMVLVTILSYKCLTGMSFRATEKITFQIHTMIFSSDFFHGFETKKMMLERSSQFFILDARYASIGQFNLDESIKYYLAIPF